MTKTELSINSGKIYAGMCRLAEAKQELKNKVQEIYSDPKLSDEGKTSEEALYRGRYEEICKKTNEDVLEAINELQTAVNTSKFTPTQEMRDVIDFIETMKAGGCLSDRLLSEQLSKFRGEEMNLIYLREKLKNCIGTAPFDNLTFSGYSKADFDKPAKFIPPDRYFGQLREALEKSDNTMIGYLADGLESRLGIESVGRQNYREQQKAKLQTMTENTPQLI